VLGILYLRDVARLNYEQPVGAETMTVVDLARPVLFAPESQHADSLLRRMQLESNHLAMVVDEYGGIAGLVTLEDLIEELVGDISDEYDHDLPEVGDLFGIELDDDDVDSVGGLLTKTLGRLPVKGSTATVSGLVLTADRTEGRRRRVSTVVVERDQAALLEAASADSSTESD
jgi:CBS domain containing-hemolysin-like protein